MARGGTRGKGAAAGAGIALAACGALAVLCGARDPAPPIGPSPVAVSPSAARDAGPDPAMARADPAMAHAGPAVLDPEEQRRLLATIARQLDAHYVSADVGRRMADWVRARAAAPLQPAGLSEFAADLTAQLRAQSHDPHLLLEPMLPADEASAEDVQWREMEARNRASSGFGPTSWLPGHVAALRLDSFEPGQAVRAAAADHMSRVADADALILDLRDNHGGSPDTVALLASYLFDGPRVHVNDMWWRDGAELDAYYTTPDAPGRHFGGRKPVVVVVSHVTFSAAEELAYDLQALRRARIVGETTRGGAHPVAVTPLPDRLSLRVPTGRAINPVTGTDWEGTGVHPDVAAPAADALHVAHVEALRMLLASPALDAGRRGALQAALRDALQAARDGTGADAQSDAPGDPSEATPAARGKAP